MIEILAAGPLVSIQDIGRAGYRRFGIGSAGAMDILALTVGNLLVGNPARAAGVEITASGLRLRFGRDAAFALTGADGNALLDSAAIPPWWTAPAKAGQELVLQAPKSGLRTYLAVSGGVDVPEVMGSRSTDVKCGFGGLLGRSLAPGDVVAIANGAAELELPSRGFGVHPPASLSGAAGSSTTVRVLPAAQYGRFPVLAQQAFWSSDWTLRPESNRIGFRLSGPSLELPDRVELLSHGIVPGVIQVPPSGQPIIQASDANTCGGYPKIGVVIRADLWRLGQVRLGSKIQFVEVSREGAIAALRDQVAYVTELERGIRLAHALKRQG